MKRPPLSMISDAALVFWVALLPLQTRWFLHRGMLAGGVWEYGTLSLYATDLLLVIAGVAALADRSGSRRPVKTGRSMLGAAIALVLVVAFSSVVASDAGVALGTALRFAFGLWAAWLIATSRMSLVTFAVALIASAAVESIVVLVQFTQQGVPASTVFGLASHAPDVAGDAVVETSIGRFLRGYGTLPHPNMAAGWLALGLTFCSGLYLKVRDRLERAVLLAVFCLISAGLFLTFSRAGLLGWLAVFVILVGGTLLRERRDAHAGFLHWFDRRHFPSPGLKTLKLVSATVLLLGVFLWVFQPLVQGRADAAGRIEQASISERSAQLSEARNIIARNWLLGVGVGNYSKAVHDVVDGGRQTWGYQPVHNVAALLLAELGFLGAFVFVTGLVVLLRGLWSEHRACWNDAHRTGVPWLAVTGLGLLLLGLLGLVDHYPWSLSFGVMTTFAVFGLLLKSVIQKE